MVFDAIELTHGGATATIHPAAGAFLTSFAVDGRSVLFTDPAWASKFPGSVRTGNPILFPIAGKVWSDAGPDSYRAGERFYHLPQHGFARHLPWRIVERTATRATCRLVSSGLTLAVFPWAFEFSLSFTLSERGIAIEGDVVNTSDCAMPLHAGFHPYLALDGAQEEFEIVVPAHGSERLAAGTEAELDQARANPLKLSATLAKTRLYGGVAPGRFVLRNTVNQRAVRLETRSPLFSTWALWTESCDAQFVCIEPWTAPPNALNALDGTPMLGPGQVGRLDLTIEVE